MVPEPEDSPQRTIREPLFRLLRAARERNQPVRYIVLTILAFVAVPLSVYLARLFIDEAVEDTLMSAIDTVTDWPLFPLVLGAALYVVGLLTLWWFTWWSTEQKTVEVEVEHRYNRKSVRLGRGVEAWIQDIKRNQSQYLAVQEGRHEYDGLQKKSGPYITFGFRFRNGTPYRLRFPKRIEQRVIYDGEELYHQPQYPPEVQSPPFAQRGQYTR